MQIIKMLLLEEIFVVVFDQEHLFLEDVSMKYFALLPHVNLI